MELIISGCFSEGTSRTQEEMGRASTWDTLIFSLCNFIIPLLRERKEFLGLRQSFLCNDTTKNDNLLSISFELGTVIEALWVLFHLIIISTLWDWYS